MAVQSASINSISGDTGSSSTDFITSDNTLTISNSITTNGGSGTVYLWLGNTRIGSYNWSGTGTTTWNFNYTGTAINDGTYTLRINSSQFSSTGGTVYDTQSLVIDATAPGRPSITISDNVAPTTGNLSDGDTTNDTTPTIRVSLNQTNAVAGDTVRIYSGNSSNPSSYTLLSEVTLSATNISNNYIDITPTLPNGAYHIRASIVDQVGNESSMSRFSQSNTTFDITVTCFYPGTLIATPEGPRAVETLATTDLVTLADGRALPVRWIGRQTVSTVFADPLKSIPIRIRAGALGENIPSRDLLVSPGHAMYVGGVLATAGALVNGTSVVREYDVPQVFSYYHIELDEHALLLAEGAPAESFVDNVDREHFDNWEERVAIEDAAPMIEMDIPVAKSHRQVPIAVRRLLTERAAALGLADRKVA